MASFTDRLMGEVLENPEEQNRDVNLLLKGFLTSLIQMKEKERIQTALQPLEESK